MVCLLVAVTSCLLPARAQSVLPEEYRSTEGAPKYFFVRFNKGGSSDFNNPNVLRAVGGDTEPRKVLTYGFNKDNYYFQSDGDIHYMPRNYNDGCLWAFVDYNEDDNTFLMVSKLVTKNESGTLVPEYLSFYIAGDDYNRNNDRFTTTTDRSKAVRMHCYIDDNGLYELGRADTESDYMNQFGGTGYGKDLGNWSKGDSNNKLTFVSEADMKAGAYPSISVVQSVAELKHKDNYYFTRIDNDATGTLKALAQETGFTDKEVNPRRVTKHEYQNVNTQIINIYVKRGEYVDIFLPNIMGYTGTKVNKYQRWYDYDTDGPMEGLGIKFDNDMNKRILVQTDGVIMGTGNGLTNSKCDRFARIYMPEDDRDEYRLAVDVTGYTDYEMSEDGGITQEPSLYNRLIYYIRTGAVAADVLKEYTAESGKFYQDEEVHFPTTANCNLYGQTLPLKYKGRNYYAYDENGELKHAQLDVTLEDPFEFGINLQQNKVPENEHLLKWGFPLLDGHTLRAGLNKVPELNKDYVIFKVTMTVGKQTYNIARFKVFFVPDTEPRPIHLVLGDKESTRTPQYLYDHAGLPMQELTYDYTRVSRDFYYTSPNVSAGSRYYTDNTLSVPIPFSRTSYAYTPVVDPLNHNDEVDVSWNGFGIIQEFKARWGSGNNNHRAIFRDISTLYREYYAEHGTKREKEWFCSRDADKVAGYFTYIDASERPGDIATIPLEKRLCEGSRIYVSAWIASGQVLVNDNGTINTGQYPASVSFHFVGYRNEDGQKKEETVYAFCPGQISGFYVDENDQIVVPSTNEAGMWKHVYFSFTVDEVFDSYALLLQNNCKSSDGGDILLDNVQIFVRQPNVEMQMVSPLCGNEISYVKGSVDFESLLSSTGLEEVESPSDERYRQFRCYYCFIDREKYDEKFGTVPEDGFTKEQIEMFHRMFPDMVVGELPNTPANIPVGTPRSAIYYFDASNCLKDGFMKRNEFNFTDAVKALNGIQDDMDSDLCYWEVDRDEEGAEYNRNLVFISRVISDALKPDHPYYIAFHVGIQKSVQPDQGKKADRPGGTAQANDILPGNSAADSGDGDHFFDGVDPSHYFYLLDECVKRDTFTVIPSSMTKVDGEVVMGESITYCRGTMPEIKVNMRVLGPDGEIHLLDNYYDWYLGPKDEFLKVETKDTEEGSDQPVTVSLQEALTNFRHYYPDISTVEELEKADLFEGQQYAYRYTAAMRELLLRLAKDTPSAMYRGYKKLLLHRKTFVAPLTAEDVDKFEMVVIPPHMDGQIEEEALYCFEPQPLVINVTNEEPSGTTGLVTVQYPVGFDSAPLRISRSQIDGMRIPETGEGNYLDVPLRLAHSSNNGVVSLVVAEDNNVYVSETDDGKMDVEVWDEDSQVNIPKPVGRLLSIDAVFKPGNDGESFETETTGHFLIQFEKGFQPREGFTYRLRVPFHEKTEKAEGVRCNGQIYFALKIVPEYQVWTGSAENGEKEWNNDENWRRADRAELLPSGTAYDGYATNEKNYEAVKEDEDGRRIPKNFAPISTTRIIIPGGVDNFPALGTRYTNPDNKKEYDETEEAPATETTYIRFDMVAEAKTDASGNYESTPYYANRCREVLFQPGGLMMRADRLDYKRAYVEYELDNNRWYTLGSPLQEMKSGEWYAPTDGLRQQTPYFLPVLWNTEDYDRYGPAVYQHSWDKGTANVYRLDGMPDPYNVAVEAEWSNVYNDVDVNYDLAGFSVKVIPMKATNWTADTRSLFRFPKDDETYLYYTIDGTTSEDDRTEMKHGAGFGRLYSDLVKDETAILEQTLTNTTAGNGYFLVTNPFVCELDMDEFFKVNSALDKKYYIVTSGSQAVNVKNGAGWVSNEGTGASGRVAPLQGFFVKRTDNDKALNVQFTTAMMTVTESPVQLLARPRRGRVAHAPDDFKALTVTATRGTATSSAAVCVDASAAEGFRPEEEAELFLDRHLTHGAVGTPMVYTLAGNRAVSVNRVPSLWRVPLGVTGRGDEEVTLRFEGVATAGAEVLLYDAVEDSSIPLSEGMEVQVSGNTLGRYFLTTAVCPAEAVGIEMDMAGTEVRLSSAQPLVWVRVTDVGGRTVYTATPDELVHSLQLGKGIYVIEARTATATLRTKILL